MNRKLAYLTKLIPCKRKRITFADCLLEGEDLENEMRLSRLTKEVDLTDDDVTSLYPWQEPDTAKPDPQPFPKLYPLINIDTAYERECEEAASTAPAKQMPYSATELA